MSFSPAGAGSYNYCHIFIVGCARRAGNGGLSENTLIVIPECCYRGSQPKYPGPSLGGQRCPITTSGMTGCRLLPYCIFITLAPTLCVGTDHPTLPRLFSFQCVGFPKPMNSVSQASRGWAVGKGDPHSHAEHGNERNLLIGDLSPNTHALPTQGKDAQPFQ